MNRRRLWQSILKMPRGIQLSDQEKAQILALHGFGVSNKKIAARLGRHTTTVSTFLRSPGTYGLKKRSGRPRKVSLRIERLIHRHASNSSVTCNQIKATLGLSVHRTTILRAIKRAPHLVGRFMKKAPALEKAHMDVRLQFAQNHMAQDWNKVVLLCFH